MKKRLFNIILLVFGAVLIIFSLIFLKDEAYKMINGILLGVGAGAIGLAFSNLFIIDWYRKHPNEKQQDEIEIKDERNEAIRNKAKAKSADIIQWVVIVAALITCLTGLPLWVTLVLIGIFLLKNIIEMAFMSKYNNEM